MAPKISSIIAYIGVGLLTLLAFSVSLFILGASLGIIIKTAEFVFNLL